MQLAKHPIESELKAPPSIREASIDSLFEAPGPLLAGIIFVVIGAAMTALKSGEELIWACVVLLVVAGAARVFELQRYRARKATLTADEAAHWQRRYWIGALIQAGAIGMWSSVTLLGSDDAVVHMICLSV